MLNGVPFTDAVQAWSSSPSVLARKREREAKKEQRQAKKQEGAAKKKRAKPQTSGCVKKPEAKGDQNQEVAVDSDNETEDRF